MPPMSRILVSELLFTSVSVLSDFLLDFEAILGSRLRSTGSTDWSEWRPKSEYNSVPRLWSRKQGLILALLFCRIKSLCYVIKNLFLKWFSRRTSPCFQSILLIEQHHLANLNSMPSWRMSGQSWSSFLILQVYSWDQEFQDPGWWLSPRRQTIELWIY